MFNVTVDGAVLTVLTDEIRREGRSLPIPLLTTGRDVYPGRVGVKAFVTIDRPVKETGKKSGSRDDDLVRGRKRLCVETMSSGEGGTHGEPFYSRKTVVSTPEGRPTTINFVTDPDPTFWFVC